MKFLHVKRMFSNASPPLFNFGAWKPNNTETFLLGRELKSSSDSYYEPDISDLIFVKLKKSKVVQKEAVFTAESDFLLEDPRVIQDDGKVIVGLTAVMREKFHWAPYPAVATFDEKNKRIGDIKVVQTFGQGKNTTPLKDNYVIFRPGSRDFYHKLLVFKLVKNKAKKCCEISIPKVKWGKWKMGTSSPPIWIDSNKALLFLTGINVINDKYTYSLGRALLTHKKDKFTISNLDNEPFITRSTFKKFSVKELHPEERSVVYMCGTTINSDDTADLFVNVGDRTTLIATAKLSDLYSSVIK